MNGNLGRDKIWTPEIWQEIDKAVLAEVGQIRVCQKIFPSTQMPNEQVVPADVFDPATMTIAEGQTKPFIEISVEFTLTQSQMEHEATQRTGRTLARMAAKLIALVEDGLLLQGSGYNPPPTVRVTNQNSAGAGLLGAAQGVPLITEHSDDLGMYRESAFKAVTRGISELIKAAQPGPYALILDAKIFGDTHAPMPATLATAADRLAPLLSGGFYGTGMLPPNIGLLISLGGEPTTLYVAQDVTTAYTQQDQQGKHRFRVFERVQFVARDPAALVILQFNGETAYAS